ncbi:hypothetical protein K504DRAFT_465673 [Pleomassaria siparia CBS 279.74]|uniref:Uncharacterized protein n=1 Tax=Pleomassaria siparia CBS 279.74 TaxID=1314801 RepID=A0A6G1JQN4_9PLEO|nr:hypothetical protein K504DRAFT_465673 [Pleomassaria siparia CBS 279.74]
MPTNAELCALQTRSIYRLDNPTFINNSCEKSPFYRGIAAHLSGARTNYLHGMFLGTTLTS